MARRETDVSDTFLDSAWYFLRYPSADRDDVAFDAALTRKWLPVASYIGGNEHAVLHLLYSRFVTMALHDIGVPGLEHFEEPYLRFRAHGTIVKDGAKMSKSRGNVVVPDELVAQWGADTVRMYLMFLGPYQEGGDFQDNSVSGIRRFLDKAWSLIGSGRQAADGGTAARRTPHEALVRQLHRTIQKVSADTEALNYNTAISEMMKYVNALREGGASSKDLVEPLVIMLAPYAPHFAEECWEMLGHTASVMDADWPAFDAALTLEENVEVVVQVNGKVRGRLNLPRGASQEQAQAAGMADPGVRKFTDGKEIRKVIHVPDKMLSIVVAN
jgi:leucyl-tRNA synthetase